MALTPNFLDPLLNLMIRLYLASGALLALLSVIFGAFGAHALRNKLSPNLMHSFETATQYQFMHSLALILVGILLYQFPANKLFAYSGNTILAGTILFSGSIYMLVFTAARQFGPVNLALITPLGGSLLIVGWTLMLAAALKV